MQEPLYSLSWQATVRPGKRVSLAPRSVISMPESQAISKCKKPPYKGGLYSYFQTIS